jgi:hypothetical protein
MYIEYLRAYIYIGTSYQLKANAWFHFMVTGIPKGERIKVQVVNASNHSNLYRYDMVRIYYQY